MSGWSMTSLLYEQVSNELKKLMWWSTNKVVLSRSNLASAKKLKLIAVSTGVNNVDVELQI